MGGACSSDGNRPSATVIVMDSASTALPTDLSPSERPHRATTNPLRRMVRRPSVLAEQPSHRETLDDEPVSTTPTYRQPSSTSDVDNHNDDHSGRVRRRPRGDGHNSISNVPVRPSAAVKDYAVVSSQNRRFREFMEDECVVVPNFVAFEGDHAQNCFFGVFDGHGGSFCSKYLARNFHSRLAATLASRMSDRSSPSSRSTGHTGLTYTYCGSTDGTAESDDPLLPQDIEKCYAETYATIDKELGQSDEALSCGSTAVTCLVRRFGGRTTFHVANVGDSRAILYTNNRTTRLSAIHNTTNDEEKRRIVNSGGIIVRHRVGGTVTVTRAFGQMNEKEFIPADPHMVWGEIESNNSFLILASDGVTDVFSDEELTTFTAKRLRRGTRPVIICDKVLHQAKVRGACDNMTLVIVFFNDASYTPHAFNMAP